MDGRPKRRERLVWTRPQFSGLTETTQLSVSILNPAAYEAERRRHSALFTGARSR